MPAEPQKKSMPSKQKAIFVLGMHRSGTSLLARIINILGIDLGNKFIAPNKDNERGFWEHEDIVNLHEKLLKELNSSWDDTRILPDNWWKKPEIKKYADEIKNIIRRDFSEVNLWGLKDPRQSRLLPLWLEVLKDLEIEPYFIITLRNPINVALSLEKRDHIEYRRALLLWILHNIEAEKDTLGYARVFINYDDVMSDWKGEISKISQALDLSINEKAVEKTLEIENFLSPALRHNNKTGKVSAGYAQIEKWAASADKIFDELGGNLSEDRQKKLHQDLQNIYNDVAKTIAQAEEIFSSWYRETLEWRRQTGKAYEALHQANLTIEAKEKNLAEANLNLSRLIKQIDVKDEIIHDIFHSTSWRITKPIRMLKKIYLQKNVFLNKNFYRRVVDIIRYRGFKVLFEKILANLGADKAGTLDWWYNRYKPPLNMLMKFAEEKWPDNAPKFSIIMCVYNTKAEWLTEVIRSILDQTYRNWELVCVNDASPEAHIKPMLDGFAIDSRIKIIHLEKNKGVSAASNIALEKATGDFICFMDHDDFLEPQALHRFAKTILSDNPDILYSDEATTYEDINTVRSLVLRPQFSYHYYLSHPYFVHFVAVRSELVKKIKGFDENLKVSHDYDFVLRALEKAKTIGHVPDVLYRWRTYRESLGHTKANEVTAASKKALANHLHRMGYKDAVVKEGKMFNFYDIDLNTHERAKVAVIIPTKNRGDLLKTCIDSLVKTTGRNLFDIYVVNHDSNEPETVKYLDELAREHHVIPYSGKFNFSKIINHGVKAAKGNYTHYLILNNDIEAIEKGWLEHMVTLAESKDIGAVGTILLYPNRVIQHAGVIIGIGDAAEHAHKFDKFEEAEGIPFKGFNGSLLANREYSAVTAACMLVKANVYNQVGGFDENLAVGFGDTDLCLRIVKSGYKIVMDSHAVLIHHESLSRGKSAKFHDPHPEDSKIFTTRYRRMVIEGDPYYSPLLSNNSSQFELKLGKVKSPELVRPRVTVLDLPRKD